MSTRGRRRTGSIPERAETNLNVASIGDQPADSGVEKTQLGNPVCFQRLAEKKRLISRAAGGVLIGPYPPDPEGIDPRPSQRSGAEGTCGGGEIHRGYDAAGWASNIVALATVKQFSAGPSGV